MAKYTLRVKNDSQQTGSVCVYQVHPDQENNTNIYSLAWFSKACQPETQLTFDWEIDYTMSWAETGELRPGVMFGAPESRKADLRNIRNNIAVLGRQPDAFLFQDTTEEGQEGLITIKADGTIPNSVASIGIGMGGKPAIALNAYANMDYKFLPHPTYWIAFGDFKEGEVIDTNRMSQATEVVFNPNVYEKTLSFTANNQWDITG